VTPVKVGNGIKVGNANITSVIPELVDVALGYFVGIVHQSKYIFILILIFSNNKKI
jgi:hypothetical protein